MTAEEAWAGGVADFGDPEAAVLIAQMPGYWDYRSAIENLLREQLGEQFIMYRSMSPARIDAWLVDPANAVERPWAFTFSKTLARAWENFALQKGQPMRVVTTMILPEWVQMRGAASHAELVIWVGDSDFLPMNVE